MVNCIGPFVLVTLKRSCLNYLSATKRSFVGFAWCAFSFSYGGGLRFTLLNSILLPSMISLRFRFLRSVSIGFC